MGGKRLKNSSLFKRKRYFLIRWQPPYKFTMMGVSESPWQGLQREIQEEIGSIPDIIKTIPIETFVSNDTVFNFHTYLCLVEDEFIPILSNEHCAWAWAVMDNAPKPLHQGLRNSFSSKIIKTKYLPSMLLLSVIICLNAYIHS